MPETGVPTAEFVRWVRQALAHLYDYAYLQDNPLTSMLDAGATLDRVGRAQQLRRALLQCIQALGPQAGDGTPAEAARIHAVLTYRYLDGLSMAEIAARRAQSQRQAYREHERGVLAVAQLLWEKAAAVRTAALEEPGDQMQVAQAEVERLQQAVTAEPLPLLEIVQATLQVLAPLAARSQAEIAVSRAAGWPTVMADRVLLRQALLSLLTHALGAQGEADAPVAISPLPHGLQIERTVGLAAASLPPEEVGLSVARGLLQAQGARLQVRRAAGQWRAQISLPPASSVAVLVVDDNRGLISLIERYLAGHRVSLVGATEGEQALRLAVELRPDLIMLDLMMPALDGWDILQKLKASEQTRGIPVVVCSVLSEFRLAESMGASDYITKPVRQASLLEVLTRWLGPLQPVV